MFEQPGPGMYYIVWEKTNGGERKMVVTGTERKNGYEGNFLSSCDNIQNLYIILHTWNGMLSLFFTSSL